MKGRSSLVLFIVVVALCAFIWIQQTWRANVPSREVRRVRLFELNMNTLVSLEFEYADRTVECVKENGVWMTGSSDTGRGRADAALVHAVVWELNHLGKGTTITEEQLSVRGFDEAEYGLDEPSLRITAVDNRGRHVWLVGRDGPFGKQLYLKKEGGEEIYTILAGLRTAVPSHVDDMRDRVAFSVDIPASRRLEVRGPNGFVEIIKDAKGAWQIQQPIVAMADDEEVEAFLEKLQAIRIDEFEADNVSDFSVYGLQGEAQQISLGGADGASRTLVFGDELPDRPDFVYARRADDTSVFALKKEVLDLLLFERDHFRDRRVLLLPVQEIDSITIDHDGEQLDLAVRENGLWSITAPVSWEAELQAVGELLTLWDEGVVVEFNDTSEESAAAWTYTFGSTSLGVTNKIEVLPLNNRRDGLRIRRDDQSATYQINIRDLPDNATDPLAYKSKLVWQLNTEDIQKVSISGHNVPSLAIERQEDGVFIHNGTNATQQIDASLLAGVLSRLTVLRTSNHVTYDPRDLSGYGLDEPAITVQVGLSGTNQLGRVLLIGEKAGEGYYSMVQGRDVVFLLDDTIVNTFSKNLFIEPEGIPPDSE